MTGRSERPGEVQHEQPQDKLLLWLALYQLEDQVLHTRSTSTAEARRIELFLRRDGVMVVGHNRFQGREKDRAGILRLARASGTTPGQLEDHASPDNDLIVEIDDRGRAKVLGIVSFSWRIRAAAGGAVEAADAGRRPDQRFSTRSEHGGDSSRGEAVFSMGHEAPLSIAVDTQRW